MSSRSHIVPTDREREFRVEELFFSTTDARGIITSCNDVFVRISGWAWGELLGAAHSIIRHPDMPRCVFKLLWDRLEQGLPVVAYVKNMARDGGYYWVTALVLPVKGGYLSVRLKPTSPILGIVKGLYQQLLAVEAGHADRKEGMAASGAALFAALAKLGFPTYDAFMKHVLGEELASREKLRPRRAAEARAHGGAADGRGLDVVVRESTQANGTFERLFGVLQQLLMLDKSLQGKTEFITEVAETTQILALNACVESARLGDEGRALSVLADNLSFASVDIARMTQELTGQLGELGAAVRDVSFDLCVAKVQVEMLREFVSPSGAVQDQACVGYDARRRVDDLRMLAERAGDSAARATQTLVRVQRLSSSLGSLADRLGKSFQTLRFVHLGGLIESARISQENGFTVILSEILENIELTRSRLGDLSEAVSAVKGELLGVELVEHAMGACFTRMSGAMAHMSV